MADNRSSHQRSFDLDALERNSWRARINQLKREFRSAGQPSRLGSSRGKSSSRRRGNSNGSMRSTG